MEQIKQSNVLVVTNFSHWANHKDILILTKYDLVHYIIKWSVETEFWISCTLNIMMCIRRRKRIYSDTVIDKMTPTFISRFQPHIERPKLSPSCNWSCLNRIPYNQQVNITRLEKWNDNFRKCLSTNLLIWHI